MCFTLQHACDITESQTFYWYSKTSSEWKLV